MLRPDVKARARRDPHVDLFGLIGVLARRRYQAAERSYASLGLNHTEARLLSMLASEGGATTQDALSRRLSVDRSNAGRAFKRLEQAGYVTPAQGRADSRTNLVDITAKGHEAATESTGSAARWPAASSATSASDAATVAALLRKAL